jgi:hypothetical protein
MEEIISINQKFNFISSIPKTQRHHYSCQQRCQTIANSNRFIQERRPRLWYGVMRGKEGVENTTALDLNPLTGRACSSVTTRRSASPNSALEKEERAR